jgi:hypothetical protein
MTTLDDLTGQRFGRLVALNYVEKHKYLCQCDCGKQSTVSKYRLLKGETKSCGCLKREFRVLSDLTGNKYARLTVIEYRGASSWLCKCDCGNELIVRNGDLSTGNTKSCGCLGRDVLTKRNTTHGLSHTKEYSVWAGMINRCYNEREKSYPNYGGRGVAVCDRWRNSFENFYADMGPRPSDNHSIERDDYNGDYKPSNCRWATIVEQANNKRSNLMLTVGGKTKTAAEFSKEIGIDGKTLRARIYRGWSHDDAIKKPLMTANK